MVAAVFLNRRGLFYAKKHKRGTGLINIKRRKKLTPSF